ncbi:expressed unknown protein [Seminavis robusta]|uniref:Uncharacterized protein n=1 Tax=Seminavis robusta TaxID=568900 RepID=A0A9N8EAN9_9STRA|nr:expressed unknown protein [Seminavis robusta]|eukprot:Sro869_g213450.1 n/a (500) ;mRNA; f:13157-14863
MVSPFEGCSEECGWIAAVVAALSYGTFGVPIKETVGVDVHPLVLQSFKSFTMFLFSWLIIFLGEPIQFTPWGLLSGLLWVCGGCFGIFAIRNAGMSVASGTWSSCMVLINFVVGIVFFQEPVSSITSTFFAFCLLGTGLVGMSVYSAPTTQFSKSAEAETQPLMDKNALDSLVDEEGQELPPITTTQGIASRLQCMSPARYRRNMTNAIVTTGSIERLHMNKEVTKRMEGPGDNQHNNCGGLGQEACTDPSSLETDSSADRKTNRVNDNGKQRTLILSLFQEAANRINTNSLTKRQLGILASIINGIFSGSSFVPLHYAKKEGFGGAKYMLSFATGAILATCMIWVVLFVTKFITVSRKHKRELNDSGSRMVRILFAKAYESMPPWHFRQMWAPGFAAGTLLAIAMFGSIISVTHLGQGVGNSIVQSKILISGLWGIFWYREIVGVPNIAKWLASAGVAVLSILWISYERILSKAVADVDVDKHYIYEAFATTKVATGG